MKISSEFSKYASHYGTYNIIQKQVAKKLLASLTARPKRILDLGCGEGALCKGITWEYDSFVGVDFAPNMLALHPKAQNIELLYGDFNDTALYEKLETHRFDMIFSASALQWADNLEQVFQRLQRFDAPLAVALFTSGTFKTLHATAGIDSLLPNSKEIELAAKKYFDVSVEVISCTLGFDCVRDMFRYIKKSGVSGSRKMLSYKQTKKLMELYPLDYLEFEVIFLISR